jgi:hypothetical protein
MALERNPDDPYRSKLPDDEYRRAARLDNELPRDPELELQPDPELAEGPASGAKIAMFAIAIVLGAIFYGRTTPRSIRPARPRPPRTARSRRLPRRLRACVT